MNPLRPSAAALILSSASEATVVVDANDERIIFTNQSFTTAFGYSAAEARGAPFSMLESEHHPPVMRAEVRAELFAHGHWLGDVWVRNKVGEVRLKSLSISVARDAQQQPRFVTGVYRDTESRFRDPAVSGSSTERVDALTGIANRLSFGEAVSSALSRLADPKSALALVVVSLDAFKALNERLGRTTGDQVLIETARRLTSAIGPAGTAARISGDEYGLVLDARLGDFDFDALLQTILSSVATLALPDGTAVSLSASLGASLSSDKSSDPEELIRQAMQAMHQAKDRGGNRCVVYDAAGARLRGERIQKLAAIAEALKNGHLVLHYQPQVDMLDGRVVGVEALIRWKVPDTGAVVSAASFMPLVENSDLDLPIARHVLRSAIAQLAKWHGDGFFVKMAINISAHHLQHLSFLSDLKAALADHPQARPTQIELEVVESSALEDLARISQTMRAVQEVGVQFALDDFGTGHASLTYLRDLPARKVKIDRSFIATLVDQPNDLIMVNGIASMAQAFDRELLAEGLEDCRAGALLLQVGCRLAQGYGIARPMPADRVIPWTRSWQPDPEWKRVAARRWSRDDFPLLYGIHFHREWVDAMRSFVDGKRPSPPELNPGLCRLGTWVSGRGRERYSGLVEFDEIVPIHLAVHSLGERIVASVRVDHQAEVQASLLELVGLRERLCDRLERLMCRVTAPARG